MSQFIATISLQDINEDFVAKIPAQRAHINELLLNRKIISYALAADRSLLWIVFNANTESEVKRIISRFPVYDFIESYSLHALMFHNSLEAVLPAISMN